MNKKKVKSSSFSASKLKKTKGTSKNKNIKIKEHYTNKTSEEKPKSGAELLEFKKDLPHLDEELSKNSASDSNVNLDINKAEKLLKQDDSPAWLKTIALIIFSCIIIFWIVIISFSLSVSSGQKIVEKNVTAITYSPVKTDISKYNSITGPSYSEFVTILGYLRKETVTKDNVASTTKYVVDDYGNKLRVISDSTYDELFTTNSRYTYNVSGLYHNTLSGYVLDIENITKQPRVLIEIKEQRVENITIGRKAGIYFDLSDGWGKIFEIIN